MNQPIPNPRSGSSATTVIVLLLAVAVAGAAWWFLSGSEAQPPPATTAAPPPLSPPEVTDKPIEPPPEVVREIKQKDSGLDEWLAIPSIIQRIAAATWRISRGESPSSLLSFLVVQGRFQVREDGEEMYVDPASYGRYDEIVDKIVSVDPAVAGRAYKRLRRNFQAAFAQVAEPGERFDTVAKQAVENVLAVEVPTGPIRVIEKGATFLYADDSLETMSAADKHVLRLGPKNAAKVQNWLRKLASAAGLRS